MSKNFTTRAVVVLILLSGNCGDEKDREDTWVEMGSALPDCTNSGHETVICEIIELEDVEDICGQKGQEEKIYLELLASGRMAYLEKVWINCGGDILWTLTVEKYLLKNDRCIAIEEEILLGHRGCDFILGYDSILNITTGGNCLESYGCKTVSYTSKDLESVRCNMGQ